MNVLKIGDPEASEEQLKRIGGKAFNLHHLTLQGFPVPPAFVVTTPNDEMAISMTRMVTGFPVAVRSSCALEDMANASFAGLYESYLFINSEEELRFSIKKCFESRNSERVMDYLNTKNIKWSDDTLRMSVLVQKMINAKIAGVLFTVNPQNGREEEMYLEFCEGVGERLVSGHVTPTQIVFNWLEDKKIKETINAELTKISDEKLKELIQLSARIQAYYGSPQDIEWAIGPDDQLYILQARPVTSFKPREDRPELTNADFKDGGISARVCTPFMYSVYREALKSSMGEYFKKIKLISNDENIQWIYYHYGRVYWNAGAVKEGLKNIPGFKEEEFDRDLGLQKDYGKTGPHVTPVNLSTIVGAVPILLGLHREFIDCKNMVLQFRERFEVQDTLLKGSLRKIDKKPDDEFHKWMLEVILFQNETEKKYFRTIYNNSNFQSEYKSFLKTLPSYEEGDEMNLMGELQGVSHLDIQSGLEKLRIVSDVHGYESRLYFLAREEFLKSHYHHGPAELDLMVPRWGENKQWVDMLVKSFCPIPTAVESQFEKTLIRISKPLKILKKKRFIELTNQSRNYLRLREEMRCYSTRAYYLLRLALLEFARRTGMAEKEAFMLDILEIKRKLLNPVMPLPNTKHRRLYYEGYRSFNPPNDFGGTMTAIRTPSHGLKGLGCSQGEITGRARVILDIHATGTLAKDEILVTLFTDPGWTPVLARVGGVITEVGGLLSHAAVIGREYGIPAILNLINATKVIQDGDLIKMNGKTGIVEILEKGSQGKT